MGAPQGIHSRLFSNISISSVNSCPNSPGWLLQRRKHSSSKLWCSDRQSYWWPSTSPSMCTHSLRWSPGEFPTDPGGIIALPCSRGDKTSLQFSSWGALAHAELPSAGKTLKDGAKWGPCKVGTTLGRRYTFSKPKFIKLDFGVFSHSLHWWSESSLQSD